jgi:type I restriction enzyme, R subunit
LADLKGERQTAQSIGLSPTGFAIYGLLGQARPGVVAEDPAAYNAANLDLAALIEEAVNPITELIDWWQKDDLQREMRSKIKRQLRAAGVPEPNLDTLASYSPPFPAA